MPLLRVKRLLGLKGGARAGWRHIKLVECVLCLHVFSHSGLIISTQGRNYSSFTIMKLRQSCSVTCQGAGKRQTEGPNPGQVCLMRTLCFFYQLDKSQGFFPSVLVKHSSHLDSKFLICRHSFLMDTQTYLL